MTESPERLRAALSGQYEIEREIGRGGTATVFLARDRKHDRPVALKVLNPELAAVVGKDRFLREIQITANLQHPHVLPLLDSGEADGFLYYVMPHVEGETVRDRIDREHRLPVDEATRIARGALSGLAYAHRQGLVHRDIKPDNILLSGGEAMIADFGIALAIHAAGAEAVTQTGISVGTPAYMSPEQAAADATVDARSDLYSLGCVLYEMLAGQPPFVSRSGESLVRQHLTVTPAPIVSHRPAVPNGVAEAIDRALAKTPADRFQDAGDFATALGVGITTETQAVASPSAGRSARGRRAAVGAAVVAVVAAVAWFTFGRESPRSPIPAEGERQAMLVVLPFENLGSPEDEYFADGITEEITSHLAMVEGLGVIARTSAIQYKNATKPIDEIGRELNVDYVLEGTVRWQKSGEGSRIRVTPQLIRVSDESHLWADRYDAVLADVFEVQTDIATQVVQALGMALLGAKRERMAERPTDDLEAYDAYLRARNVMEQDDRRETFEEAVSLFERAVELDPEFVEAWAHLGIAHAEFVWHAFDRSPERLERSRRAVERALELAPDHPLSHLANGWYHYHGLREFDAALDALRIALEGLPNDRLAVSAVGFVERRKGNFETALRHIVRAAELDPRAAYLQIEAGHTLQGLGRDEEALRYYDRARSIDPNLAGYYANKAWLLLAHRGDVAGFRRAVAEGARRAGAAKLYPILTSSGPPYMFLLLEESQQQELLSLSAADYGPDVAGYHLNRSLLLWERGDSLTARAHADSARVWLEGMIARDPDLWLYRSLLGAALASLGRKEEAIRAARQGVERLPRSADAVLWFVPVAMEAIVLAEVGEIDRAFEALERVVGVPFGYPPAWIRTSPLWTRFEDHPAYRELLAREGELARAP